MTWLIGMAMCGAFLLAGGWAVGFLLGGLDVEFDEADLKEKRNGNEKR